MSSTMPPGITKDFAVGGAAAILVLGIPKVGKTLYKGVASGKKKLVEIYAEAMNLCYPDTIEMIGVGSGRWGAGFYRLDVAATLKFNALKIKPK